MGKLFHGHIEKDTVIVEESGEASAIYNRSSTGEMVKGKLRLTMVEAFYLMNEGKLEIDISKKDFLNRALSTPDFQTRYLVYRELRKRGFLIRDDTFMYIWRGGEQKEKGEMRVYPLDEKNIFDFSKVYEMAGKEDADKEHEYYGMDAKFTKNERNKSWPPNTLQPDGHAELTKNERNRRNSTEGTIESSKNTKIERESEALIFAIVDGDGDVTYYSISRYFPEGPHRTVINEKGDAVLMDDMGIMLDAYEPFHSFFYGKKMDDALYLSTLECTYLMSKEALRLTEHGKEVSLDELLERSAKKDPELMEKLRIYSDLRDRGLIVRTGFKYGTHFRVYMKDVEQHAKYLAHAVPENYKGTWPEISRGVRLAHGVKKEFLMAEASKKARYLRIKRVRL